jgi:hypothetical protein
MAKRYSGNLTITCTLRDQGDYRCTVTPTTGRSKTVYVGAPAVGFGPGVAYDSPKAYDESAHAAISFALDEGLGGEPEYNESGSGYKLHRSPPSYYKKPSVERRAQRAQVEAQRQRYAEEQREHERVSEERRTGAFIVDLGPEKPRFHDVEVAQDWTSKRLKELQELRRNLEEHARKPVPSGMKHVRTRITRRLEDPSFAPTSATIGRVGHAPHLICTIDARGHVTCGPVGGGGARHRRS